MENKDFSVREHVKTESECSTDLFLKSKGRDQWEHTNISTLPLILWQMETLM